MEQNAQYLERNRREAGALLQGGTDKICQQHGGLKDQDVDHAHAFSQDTGVGIEQGRDGGEAGEQADGLGKALAAQRFTAIVTMVHTSQGTAKSFMCSQVDSLTAERYAAQPA